MGRGVLRRDCGRMVVKFCGGRGERVEGCFVKMGFSFLSTGAREIMGALVAWEFFSARRSKLSGF